MGKLNWLRGLGPLGSQIANILVFLTTNWIVVATLIFGSATGFFKGLRTMALNPIAYVSTGAFLIALWTMIGITVLIDRRRPRLMQTHQDYRYGLTFEGFSPNFIPTNSMIQEAGALQYAIQLRNFSSGPIKYVLESISIQIGSRSIPKYKASTLTGYMARGAGRQTRIEGFHESDLKEFYGQGMPPVSEKLPPK